MGSSAPLEVRDRERRHELTVSGYLADTEILAVAVDDPPGPDSRRGTLERGLIALLANGHRAGLDPPSPQWLGHHAPTPAIRASGLWNVNHTHDAYDPAALELFARCLEHTPQLTRAEPPRT